MKVIEEHKKEKATMEIICTECGSKLEIEAADLSVEHFPYSIPIYTFQCPCCGERNHLKYEELSKGIYHDIHRRS